MHKPASSQITNQNIDIEKHDINYVNTQRCSIFSIPIVEAFVRRVME